MPSVKNVKMWTTESSPVYASPRGEDPEGRMTELVNVSEMVSREKHPGEGNGKPPLSMCQENCFDQESAAQQLLGKSERGSREPDLMKQLD